MLWAAEGCKRQCSFTCGHLEALGLTWSPAEALLAAGSHSGALNFYAVAESEAVEGAFTLALSHSVRCGGGEGAAAAAALCVAFSSDGASCAAGHADGSVSLVGVAARAVLARLQPGGVALPVRCLAFWGGAEGGQQQLVTGGDDARVVLRWWGAQGGQEGQQEVLAAHLGFITSVAASVSVGCPFIASASADKTALLWDTRKRAPVAVLEGMHSDRVNAVAFCPDGRFLASASDGGLLVLSKLPGWS